MDLHAENGALIPATLRTARLTLRPLAPRDDAAIVAALADWDVVRWLTAVPWPYTPADAIHFRTIVAADPAHPHWAIDAGDGLIGVISVKPDLGYWLAPAHHRRGYMSEAAQAVVTAAFAAGHRMLVSGHLPGNVPSRRLLSSLGFTDTHLTTALHRGSGETVPLQRMTLTAEDWAARHG